jgi:predicted transcriptional regulator
MDRLAFASAGKHIQPVAFTDDVTDWQVPPLLDKEEVRERLKRLAGGPTQPLTVHLRQEIDRYVTIYLPACV